MALLLLLYVTMGHVGRNGNGDVASADPIFTTLPIIMPSPPPTNAVVVHEVAEGESLGSIAVQYGVDRAAIANANQIATNSVLQLGQKLVIPNPAAALTPLAPSETPSAVGTPSGAPGGEGLAAAAENTATATVVAMGGALVHTVVQGDTLRSIAGQYAMAVEDVAAANGLGIDDTLSIGQQVAIPQAAPQTATPTAEGATATAEPVPTATPRSHTIASGDTLNWVARQYGVSVAEIVAANGITQDTVLSLGQVLVIPAPAGEAAPAAAPTEAPSPEATPAPERVVHVVGSGDTLGRIAVQYDVSVAALTEANGITDRAILSIGQELIIPDESAATATPEPTAAPTAVPTVAAATEVVATEAAPTEAAGPVKYAVQGGDTLGAIAARFGVDTDRIAEANNLTLTTILSVGQELIIPDVTPTPGPTAEATATSELTPTAVLSLAELLPTRDPDAAGYPYRDPVLLVPTNGSRVAGQDAPVVLAWASVGVLSATEWYHLELWTPDDAGHPLQVWTRATSYRVSAELYPGLRRNPRLVWRVTVVQRPTESDASTPLSLPSDEYTFTWQ